MISRVPRTAGSGTRGALVAGALANHPTNGCITSPASASTHSGHSQSSASDMPDDVDLFDVSDLSMEEFGFLARSIALMTSMGCGIAKNKEDWPQRICSLRQVCNYAEVFASGRGVDDVLQSKRDVCVRALRELARSLSKIAQLAAAPKASGKISGRSRKKYATMRSAVGHFVGPDVLRALLAIDVYHTTRNIALSQFVVKRADLLTALGAIIDENEQPKHTIADAPPD